MVVKIVTFLVEMFVESEASFTFYVTPVGIEPQVRWGFRLPHILIFAAFDTVSQVNAEFAPAIEFVPDFEGFPGLVASEVLRFSYLATAFILG